MCWRYRHVLGIGYTADRRRQGARRSAPRVAATPAQDDAHGPVSSERGMATMPPRPTRSVQSCRCRQHIHRDSVRLTDMFVVTVSVSPTWSSGSCQCRRHVRRDRVGGTDTFTGTAPLAPARCRHVSRCRPGDEGDRWWCLGRRGVWRPPASGEWSAGSFDELRATQLTQLPVPSYYISAHRRGR